MARNLQDLEGMAMKRLQGLPAFGGASPQDSGLLRRVDRDLPARLMAGNPARFKAGFTKLELLVTMSIMAISASLAVPGFVSWLPNYRLKGAVRDLYSNLVFAKSGAIRDRGEWAVKFDAAGNSYQVVSGGLDGIYSTTDDNVVLKTVSLLTKYPQPTEEQIKKELEGNICRCTGYENMKKAVKIAVERMAATK
jgi:prepilin-type N-terminal cleavage/methylation domain-containing protein